MMGYYFKHGFHVNELSSECPSLPKAIDSQVLKVDTINLVAQG
jgi:hypothetical protein